MKIFVFLALSLTGCSSLSEVRLGWDFNNNSLMVSVPLAKPTSLK